MRNSVMFWGVILVILVSIIGGGGAAAVAVSTSDTQRGEDLEAAELPNNNMDFLKMPEGETDLYYWNSTAERNLLAGECDKNNKCPTMPCCSRWGYCGSGPAWCDCDGCVNYQYTESPLTTAEGGSDCDYSTTFSTSHTMNLSPKSECGIIHKTGVSEDEIKGILKKHNELRAKVANGLESPQPGATNMLEMQWNIELAEVAQAWSEQCSSPGPDAHDEYDDRKICSQDYSVGQNIAYRWGYNAVPVWDAAIEGWYSEVKDMPLSHVESFAEYNKVIGHYTQMVWATTYEVGCGAIYYPSTFPGDSTIYPESKIYVCNYGPAGNTKNKPVYESGTAAATNCPNGPSSTYPGLCATPVPS